MLVWACQHFSGEINGGIPSHSLSLSLSPFRPAKGSMDVKYVRALTHKRTNEHMINECGRIELQLYVMWYISNSDGSD